MDLNAVRLFVHVVQGGSLSAGADRAGVPLPTMSRRIRELERQLEVQLFDRSARGARLTQAGSRLYDFALRGVETLEDGEQAVRSDQAKLRGRLRLSVPPAFEPWWRLLAAFQERYPGVELVVYSTERRLDLIEDGIDVALRVGAIEDESLVARRILSYRHQLVASPALLDRLGEPAAPGDLIGYPLATWTSSPSDHAQWRLGDQEIEPAAILASNDYLHLRDCALSGAAVTELPPFLAAPSLASGRLRALLPDHALPEQSLHLLYPVQRFPSTIVRAYLDFCREKAAGVLGATDADGGSFE
jgi:DNA-binding transcriptional LysR family regulator